MNSNDPNSFINDFASPSNPSSNFLNMHSNNSSHNKTSNNSSTNQFMIDNSTSGHSGFNFGNGAEIADWSQLTPNNFKNNKITNPNDIPYTNSSSNFGINNMNNSSNNSNSNINNNSNNNMDFSVIHSQPPHVNDDLDMEEFDKQFIESLMDEIDQNGINDDNVGNSNKINDNNNNNNNNNNINNTNTNFNINNNDKSNNNNNNNNNNSNNFNVAFGGIPIATSNTENNQSINTLNTFNSSATQGSVVDSAYQSPQPIATSLARDTSLRADTFSPQSLGFSSNFANHQLGKTLSNTLGKSYNSQLGTSLNNLMSPSSTYDGFLDSPYGSYNDDSLKSPINSPSFKSIGSPSSVGTHINPKNALSKENKLSRRRELHNAVERRRRDLIKEKIKELGALIPPTMLYNSTKSKNSGKDAKANKNVILNKSVEYIMYLKEILAAQDKRLEELEKQAKDEHVDVGLNANINENSFEDIVKENSMSLNANPDIKLENFQKDLSAFTEDVGIKSSDSKLKFMDFSNAHSEPLDFKQLSESFKGDNNVDSLLNLDSVDDGNLGIIDHKEFDQNVSHNTLQNGLNGALNNGIQSPTTHLQHSQSGNFASPDADFEQLLNDSSSNLKYRNDAEFLDQLLAKEPTEEFGI